MTDHCPVFVQISILLTHIHDRSLSCLCTDIDTPNTYKWPTIVLSLHRHRYMSSHVYVLSVSMSVQRQENEESCICVRCIDVCSKTEQLAVMNMIYMTDHCPLFEQTSIHLTHIHDRSLSCLCTEIDTPNTYIWLLSVLSLHKHRTMVGHVYVLGVSMSVQRQDNGQSCICVRCIDVWTKTGQWAVMHMCYITEHCPVFAQTSIHLTHIHDRSLSCLCTSIDTPNAYTWPIIVLSL
jgi:hypothetical protein